MAITDIVATPKASNANSYATAAEATDYFKTRLHVDSWFQQAQTNRNVALIWATRILDTTVRWYGVRTTDDQALAWPRKYVVFADSPSRSGQVYVTNMSTGQGYAALNDVKYLDADTIPNFLIQAVCEQALAIIGSDITLDSGLDGYSKLELGPLKIDLDRLSKPSVLPRSVRNIIKPYGEALDVGTGKGMTSAQVVRS